MPTRFEVRSLRKRNVARDEPFVTSALRLNTVTLVDLREIGQRIRPGIGTRKLRRN